MSTSVSIWASIFSWFTPTVFFVFLNLTIGTIYFTSSLASNNSNKPERQESDETNPKLVRSPSVLQRTKSDTVPASGEVLPKLPRKMKKSASVKSAFSHFEEEDIVETRRPATVREGKAKATEEDEEVDAKADDFINKFKQQLKLQRIDSILRYKETVKRGN
ncbi:hypothetical protein COLO4_21062 [Corchorus olitorius]|uniref:DUF4408 domain-containing protein n=1 Tax=Corchorus olitorius TaxID=93759 RepID=A0A1R3IVG5_9ROSI|nr:hypothetical protein COLO4_21062 [Corchorus olitorius]